MKTIRNYILLPVMLSLFDGELNPNLTTSDGMSAEMKIFYSDYLIDLAEPELVHDQFGQKHHSQERRQGHRVPPVRPPA